MAGLQVFIFSQSLIDLTEPTTLKGYHASIFSNFSSSDFHSIFPCLSYDIFTRLAPDESYRVPSFSKKNKTVEKKTNFAAGTMRRVWPSLPPLTPNICVEGDG